MACTLFAGEVWRKKCAICGIPLMPTDIVYEWDGQLCEVGCLIKYATKDRSPPMSYQTLGTDWIAP